ncbi:MAG: acyl-CoA dehydrogenase [Bacteriovoracaceae bacterium]|nr:acyl-CoA dehydrogenase [Bacteriovoracaceae bacterium]
MSIESNYKDIREMAAKFADKELAPLAAQIDKEAAIPPSVIKKLSENGFMGIFIPEEYGGSGMDYTAYAIIMEELSRGCASTGVVVSVQASLSSWPILQFGTEEQKKKYLPKLASGEHIGCFCLTEPDAGSDAGSLTTFAEDKGDYYEITGNKNFISNGKEATVAIVFAKTEKTANYKGISAFIVEANTPGYSVAKLEEKMGIKGSSTAQITFDKVRVPKENLLGQAQKGFRIAMATLDGGRLGIAAQALGIGEAAFRFAKKYSKERIQFGAPIANLQGIQFILADMSTKLQASRLLILDSSEKKTNNEFYSKSSAQAKLMASEAAMWVTTKAIQVCGGNGYSKEFPVERHFRDAKITEIYEGTSEVQKIVIAGLELKETN